VKRKTLAFSMLCLALIFVSCSVTVTAPETKINIQNDMLNVPLTIGGSPTTIGYIDVEKVTIGDVYFSARIQAGGDISETKTTALTGHVDITIGLATTPKLNISNIILPSITIRAGVTNTVVFDANTAAEIYSQALAKKKAQ
jgi:hypothetical protein